MALTAGTPLGAYEIVAAIGAAGWARSIERRTPSSVGTLR